MGAHAKAGGEHGVNGEWYEGGKFMPSRADRAKQAPIGQRAGGRVEIEPGVWGARPCDGAVSIWQQVKAFVDQAHMVHTGELRIYAGLNVDGPGWGYMSRGEIVKRLDALMAGHRWELNGAFMVGSDEGRMSAMRREE